jgi:hypothetical protein
MAPTGDFPTNLAAAIAERDRRQQEFMGLLRQRSQLGIATASGYTDRPIADVGDERQSYLEDLFSYSPSESVTSTPNIEIEYTDGTTFIDDAGIVTPGLIISEFSFVSSGSVPLDTSVLGTFELQNPPLINGRYDPNGNWSLRIPAMGDIQFNNSIHMLQVFDGHEWLDIFSAEELYEMAQNKFRIPDEDKEMQRFNVFEKEDQTSEEIAAMNRKIRLYEILSTKLLELEKEINK